MSRTAADSRVLLTGATGFVGRAMLERLRRDDSRAVTTAVRKTSTGAPGHGVREVVVGDHSARTIWREALQDVDVVVHTAARAHVMRQSSGDPNRAFLEVNTEATLALAEQAAAQGVRRLIFVSSVKVNGEQTERGIPFRESDTPRPTGSYAVSKHLAEQGLMKIAEHTGMQVVCVRPPLIYGPDVRANLRALMRAVRRGLPLPLAAVDNRRSLIGLDNLVDVLALCLDHPAAANKTFLVSDGEDLSTPELIRRLARVMDLSARLWPVPVSLLRIGAAMLGRQTLVDRLCGDLQVDSTNVRMQLGWRPPLTIDEGLARAVSRC